MDKIQHKTIQTNGINMHVAEIGDGPAVLLLHGFPELWYSWRHQMLFLSSRGYRAIAPDLRGFGDSDAPPCPSSYTAFHKIQHKTIQTNGINMHVAEIGDGPAVLLLHGFPELWYSWRHQMLFLSSRGYRAIAPDLRGFGDSDAPPCPSSYTAFHIIGDLVGLLDAMGLDRVFLVGHDWGAVMAWYFCLIRPDRIKALVNMSVVFHPRNPKRKPVESMRAVLGEDYYICRFQKPGEAEEEFARVDTARLIKKVLTTRDPAPLRLPKEVGFGCLSQKPMTMPSWLSEDDVQYYAAKFDQKGFTGSLNYYRVMDLNWELTAPWTGVQIKVPVKFIVGDLDLTYNTAGVKKFIHNGGFKQHVPYLQELVIMEGVAHFLNQEKPDEISQHIYDFIHKFSSFFSV